MVFTRADAVEQPHRHTQTRDVPTVVHIRPLTDARSPPTSKRNALRLRRLGQERVARHRLMERMDSPTRLL